MKQFDTDRILTIVCLILSILAYIFTCHWYIGIIMAVVSVGLAIYHNKHFKENKIVRAGSIISIVYLGCIVLILLFMLMYYSLLK